jgi:hypothetical protein
MSINTPTATSTRTSTFTASPSSTSTNTSTPSPTSSATPRKPPSPYPPQSIFINEIAWAGTLASSSDEWIELHNPGSKSIDLNGWKLTDGGDINISLSGTLPAYSFYLLERTDNNTISDIRADLIYTGSLRNSGEALRLLDPSHSLVDSASYAGGWPAGDIATHFSMERRGGSDIPGNWGTFTGYGGNGHDADGNPVPGTPKRPNSILSPIPTNTPAIPPTPYPPQSVFINEIAWAGTLASSSDEWIELHNPGSTSIELSGWILSDGVDLNIALSGSLAAHSFYLLERSDDSTIIDITADQIYTGGLNNNGETLALKDPTGSVVDSANYPGGWPAGDAATRFSMERRGGADIPGNWGTFTGQGGNGHDADGNPIPGTPRQPNSLLSPIPTPSPSPPPTPSPPQSVLIHEIAWAGTLASSSDEWIELHNPGALSINLDGWGLSDGGDINIILSGDIGARSYFLLERTDDNTVADIAADQIYSGNLTNSGETLRLEDPTGNMIDSANSDGGGWPAGDEDSRASMERRGGTDIPGNWGTFTGHHGVGHDADGNPIPGTPRSANSVIFPTPAPTWIPGKLVINEALIRPHYDWEHKGGVDTGDEFIELYNLGPSSVNIGGWMLDDEEDGGSRPYRLPNRTIRPGEFVAFFNTRTRIALNDAGDDVRLMSPDGRLIDQISYLRVRAYNLSFGRLPDGSGHLLYGLWPTPSEPNILFEEPFLDLAVPLRPGAPIVRPARLGRHPSLVCWMNDLGHVLFPEGTEGHYGYGAGGIGRIEDDLPLLPLHHPRWDR